MRQDNNIATWDMGYVMFPTCSQTLTLALVACTARQMDVNTYQEVLNYIKGGRYPNSATKSQKHVIRRRSSVFRLDGELLYHKRRKNGQERLVVCGIKEARQIFRECHVNAIGVHSGIVRTRDKACKKFYWPGMTADLDKWVRECTECQTSAPITKQVTEVTPIQVTEYKESQTSAPTIKQETEFIPVQATEFMENQTTPPSIKQETEFIPVQATETMESQTSAPSIKQETEFIPVQVNGPFELVGMNIIGEVTKTEAGNVYICVMVDYFTKWTEAFALASKTAESVAACVVKFYYRFGAPKRILTDEGQEFVHELNKEVCKHLGIDCSLCAPCHPQTNGPVKKFSSTIKRALRQLVSNHPNQWDLYLDAIMFELRTKKHVTTEFSPFLLLFGTEARLLSEVPQNFKIDSSVEDAVDQEVVSEATKQQDSIYSTISCESCGRRFHHVYVGRPKLDEKFVCAAC